MRTQILYLWVTKFALLRIMYTFLHKKLLQVAKLSCMLKRVPPLNYHVEISNGLSVPLSGIPGLLKKEAPSSLTR